jgi:MarR family transcriptional regulator, organic hydroperoxide resistance regulator
VDLHVLLLGFEWLAIDDVSYIYHHFGVMSMTRHVSSAKVDSLEELRFLVLGAQREGSRALSELLAPIGLTAAQAEVLAVLRDEPRPLTVGEIGQRLVCEGGSPSRLVATVVDRGLAQRTPSTSDRRAVELTLTGEGRAAAERVADAERRLYEWLSQTLTKADITTLIRGLRKLVDGRPTGQAIARRRDSQPTPASS